MRGEGNPFGKGFSLSPHAPLSLPKTFVPVSGRWCSATGGRRCPVPRMAWEGGKFCSGMQKRPVILTGRFLQWQGRNGAVQFYPRGVISSPLGSRGRLTIQETGWPGEFCLLHERSDERSPVSFWPGSSHLAAPHPKTGTCMQIRKRGFGREGEGRPGAALRAVPVTTKEVTGIESWLEGEPFLEKVSLPRRLACAFYSWARPMPGRAASRPAPRRKRPASSKALPMSCMPTGILLSAAMPTGRDRPGRPARFRDRV